MIRKFGTACAVLVTVAIGAPAGADSRLTLCDGVEACVAIEKNIQMQEHSKPSSRDVPYPSLAQASCAKTSLASQCANGCSAAASCRSDAISFFAAQCQSGAIDPGTAAQKVSLACESCNRQNCR